MGEAIIIPAAGAAIGYQSLYVAIPSFTYTGEYALINDGGVNWRIRFLTSGTFKPTTSGSIDVFLVGGGGGAYDPSTGSGGGGGGYTATYKNIQLVANTNYTVTVGAGGIGADGRSTSAFGHTVSGGGQGRSNAGGAGGSGGGGAYDGGGSDGSDGTKHNTYYPSGKGQGTTTREFGESTGQLYAGGGAGYNDVTYGGGAGGGANRMMNAADNTGGGAGGDYSAGKHNGGSGIVVIRNHR